MALAQRLNDLAAANASGLLNDDEYRLLRQSAFEEQSSLESGLPREAAVIPRLRPHDHAAQPETLQARKSKDDLLTRSDSCKSAPSSARLRTPLSFGVVNLLRRATGRKPSIPQESPAPKESRKSLPLPGQVPSAKKGLGLPKLLQRKPTHLTIRTSSLLSVEPPTTAASFRSVSATLPSPSGSAIRVPIPSDPPLLTPDIFDDSTLVTAQQIRLEIQRTEAEASKLAEAFDNLETSTARRIQRQNARRLHMSTPSSIDVLLEGREWREYRLVPSSSTPVFDNRTRQLPAVVEPNADRLSIRSGSSFNTTTLSMSKSASSLPKQPLPTSLSHHLRNSITVRRKGSLSSVSSQGTSLTPSVIPTTPSRSATHLPLQPSISSLALSVGTTPPPSASAEDDFDGDAELVDVRRKKVELAARYAARLDFLRAKLKGAELHEKLLKK